MNIFIIPSWYPEKNNKISGIFTYEQAKAISEHSFDNNVIVSLWGQEDNGYLNRNLFQNFNKLIWYIKSRRDQIKKDNNYYEIFNPQIHWTKRLPFGGINRLVKVNRKNLELAQEKIGKIHIIHAHVSYPAGYIAYILSKELDIPYIITEHMAPFPFKNYLVNNRPIIEITTSIKNANAVIAVSPFLDKELFHYGFQDSIIIPNLVDENVFYPNDLNQNSKFTFLTTGVINERKGIDLLIKAISLWNPDSSKVHFRIIGKADKDCKFKKLAEDLKISNLIEWIGEVNREDIPNYFRNSDAFVLFSRYETFGVVYAEAIASGIPFVSTPCGGVEFIYNEEVGILTKDFEINSLCDSLESIYANYSKYNKIKIRNYFLNKFSKKIVINQIFNLYHNILKLS